TFKGWRDELRKPDPSASPVPDCYLGSGATPAPPASLDPNATVLDLGIAGILEYDKHALDAPAGQVFAIKFDNSDAGQTHDVDLRDSTGAVLDDQATITGPAEATYVYKPLTAGTYTFICSVHPIANMTGTLTVK
ncbi:MAG: cupredoxin domain-containing protein, partial [Gammaproteobacteria bacterium]